MDQTTQHAPAPPPDVAAVYDGFPAPARRQAEALRRLLFAVAAERAAGPLTETLKWGEPAYLTEATRSGSTVRIGWKPARPDRIALYFNCRTTLVDDVRSLFPDRFRVEGNRALLLDLDAPLPEDALRLVLGMALTYHRKTDSEPHHG